MALAFSYYPAKTRVCMYEYMHKFIHAYMHVTACMHVSMHACMHACGNPGDEVPKFSSHIFSKKYFY